MNHTMNALKSQEQTNENWNQLHVPHNLTGFQNTHTLVESTKSGRTILSFMGELSYEPGTQLCKECQTVMHINQTRKVYLRHLAIGYTFSNIQFNRYQFYCPCCGRTEMQVIPFKSDYHFITTELEQYVHTLLSMGTMTLKTIAHLSGVGKNMVKAIDLRRLKGLYTVDSTTLIKPEVQAKYLGIDEFKLHHGHQYATHIINLENGHILWIAKGKKKQVVYDFIEHVGMEWMEHIEAIACDMNSNFQEAFEDKCPDMQIVFDHFHIVKNLNEKVISEIRKDEQNRLIEQGDLEAARFFKKSRYILFSRKDTLKKKDDQARAGIPVKQGNTLFNMPNITRKEGYQQRYEDLLKENELLICVDMIKEKLRYAYTLNTDTEMANAIDEVIGLCEESKNKHLLWFKRLLTKHYEGIISHATYKISAGKIEGINNKIKTLRRQGYGYPDDEYFFLKLFDMSRQQYVRNPKSHNICD